MKFNFKIQQYQTDAVDAVISVFNGQPYLENRRYIRDLGRKSTAAFQTTLDSEDYNPYDDTGYRNAAVELTETQILKNIQNVQNKSSIKTSTKLENSLGACSLDIAMETGTGKTYVYIKTIFELNQKYSWSKFTILVTSIAMREGDKI